MILYQLLSTALRKFSIVEFSRVDSFASRLPEVNGRLLVAHVRGVELFFSFFFLHDGSNIVLHKVFARKTKQNKIEQKKKKKKKITYSYVFGQTYYIVNKALFCNCKTAKNDIEKRPKRDQITPAPNCSEVHLLGRLWCFNLARCLIRPDRSITETKEKIKQKKKKKKKKKNK